MSPRRPNAKASLRYIDSRVCSKKTKKKHPHNSRSLGYTLIRLRVSVPAVCRQPPASALTDNRTLWSVRRRLFSRIVSEMSHCALDFTRFSVHQHWTDSLTCLVLIDILKLHVVSVFLAWAISISLTQNLQFFWGAILYESPTLASKYFSLFSLHVIFFFYS